MVAERIAAYVLALVCVFQTLRPFWIIKPHCWQRIDVQIGWLRVQARNDADSVCFEEWADEQNAYASAMRMPLLHSWQKKPKRLTICISDSGCITAWLDGTSHAWSISNDEKANFDQNLMEIYGKSDPSD
jgi:hypothetical protein